MKFSVTTLTGYPSYQEEGTKWDDRDWKAWRLVLAIKQKPFKGYADFGAYHIADNPAGRARALVLAATVAISKLKVLGITKGTLVPVPSSQLTEFGGDCAGQRLANAIATAAPNNFSAVGALAFINEMPKAAGGGGTREPSAICANLKFDPSSCFEDCILVDDVISTGGHLTGAARKLEQNGKKVVGAICVAQTVWSRPANMFDIPVRELNTEPEWFEF